MKYVTRLNWLVIAIWSAIIATSYHFMGDNDHFIWIDIVTVAGVAVLQVLFYGKIKSGYGFSLVLLYTLALLQGMRIMLSIDQVFSLVGILFIILKLLLIFYFIGVRGFLRSNKGRSYFSLPVMDDEQS
ncbi:MAG: hypothetical protein V2I33_13675 [Kangiellaceae bacterium]|jgi:hypothetical protein|nr:hypothetical protein [Kangiellaceae bacterium]